MMRPLPAHLKEGIDLYVSERIPTGGFLEAVLSNNLRETFRYADETSLDYMLEIVAYCYNEIPSTCWGSPQAVRDWLRSRRSA